jgi:hypothetical protein
MNVHAEARNELPEDALRRRMLAHCGVCDRCSNRLTEERVLMRGIRVTAAILDKERAPARVEAALMNAFHARVAPAASASVLAMSVRTPVRTRYSPVLKLATVAAGILVLIFIAAIFLQRETPVSPNQDLANEAVPSPEPQPGPVAPDTPNQSFDQLANPTGNPRPRRAVRQRPSEEPVDEVVTEFFALVEGERLVSLDSLQVIRVELPSSALLTVGLPVDVETPNEPVKADVVLGQDGLARAIRFVR